MDLAEQSEIRASQEILANHIQKDGATTTVKMANTGFYNVTVFAVLIDGVDASYTIQNQGGDASSTMKPESLYTMTISGVGDIVQVVTESGKLFEIDTS